MRGPFLAPKVPMKHLLLRLSTRLAAWRRRLSEWRHHQQGRRQLAAMDARELKDIGLSESDRLVELGKTAWSA
jgi:uncharacterized protein YjiS (DUF1127 family)